MIVLHTYLKQLCSGYVLLSFPLLISATAISQPPFSATTQLQYCQQQARKTLASLPADTPNIPRSIPANARQWKLVDYKDWTSGFWPGILWYLFEASHTDTFNVAAAKYASQLEPLSRQPAYDHDLGFQVYCSYGNGYRLTNNPAYKKILLATADTLATLYNPKVGTILSWPREVKHFGAHNTIMDNMMNLELLFWAAKHGGSKHLYDIARQHAITTMHNHFRKDYSSYHVVLYDTLTGKKIKGITHQGYADESMWARGQSWAIYGFTMCYRETKDTAFLNFAQKVADVYLQRLPADLIPYWDFDAQGIPNIPKDASAACVTASALLELSGFVTNKTKAAMYRAKAVQMLQNLSTDHYLAKETNTAFLLHSTGHKPNNSEVDASIIYADYYYVEALLRLQKL
ncbi:glycosyl hydrolase [Russula earlei]|uniref:Glycosyl hydrolase n=1 Tax=Russula earlei TaxID=71964 RepID=A0ACC0TQB5_9AGAM|nr:glycosyl hydrolase [Russula earlei]